MHCALFTDERLSSPLSSSGSAALSLSATNKHLASLIHTGFSLRWTFVEFNGPDFREKNDRDKPHATFIYATVFTRF